MKTIEGRYRDVTNRPSKEVNLLCGSLIAGVLLNLVWRFPL